MINIKECPNCGSSNHNVERSMKGTTSCNECSYTRTHMDWLIVHQQKEISFLESEIIRLKNESLNKKEGIYFETIEDIWRFLMEGGAVTNLDDSCDTYVFLHNGNPIYNDETQASVAFNSPSDWRPYPNKKLLKDLLKFKKLEKNYVLRRKIGNNIYDYVLAHRDRPTDILAWVIPRLATMFKLNDAVYFKELNSEEKLELVSLADLKNQKEI